MVTGEASGIGGAISRVLTQPGAKVVPVDIDERAGAALAEEIGDGVCFLGDVSDPGVAQRRLRATLQFILTAYPELRKQGGSVGNFGSGAGLEGQATQAAYAFAKEAIRGLSRVVAKPQLIFMPSTSPSQPSRSAYLMRAARLSPMSMSLSRWAMSGVV